MAEKRGSLFWGLVFLWVPIFGVGVFVVAKAKDWWLPPSASSFAPEIDSLFFLILWITGIAFVITEVALVWFLIKHRYQEGKKAKFVHSNKPLEIAWTIVPGLILLFLALYQKGTWDHIKDRDNFPKADWEVRVTAKQFAWQFDYPGADKTLDTEDDKNQGQLWVPVDEFTVIGLRSVDVLHSFFLPHMRLKQDAIPGKQNGVQTEIPVWFKPVKTTEQMRKELYEKATGKEGSYPDTKEAALELKRTLRTQVRAAENEGREGEPDARQAKKELEALSFNYELACAELCGLGHYQMKATLVVATRAECEAYVQGN